MHKQKLLQAMRPVGRTVSDETVGVTFQLLCEAIDSPVSLAAWLRFKYQEFAQLVGMEVQPNDYLNSHKFADDYLAAKFLSKYDGFKHQDLDPRKKAVDSFEEAEMQCKQTNLAFRALDLDPSKWDPFMHRILRSARRKISWVLGVPNLDAIAAQFGWGPGANSSAKGNRTAAYCKFKAELHVTSNALIMGHCCINSIPSWTNCLLQTDSFPSAPVSITRDQLKVVRGNEIVFVPKNAKTERVIAIEPAVNSFLQKGFGGEIRRLLRSRAGVDLNDQSVNQRLAKEGSITGKLATLDLKSASDTISYEVVKFLLPRSWFSLLDSARSKQGRLKDGNNWIYFQKFSSMGNGFTFELESLLFWALAQAVAQETSENPRVSVYGDDIIVNTESYEPLKEVLKFCGFTVNEAKSFATGPFRESCGKDYFSGTEVRSIFLKKVPSNVESLYKLANSIRRYSHIRGFNRGCDRRFYAAYSAVCNRIPSDLRFLVPEGLGDIGLIENFDLAVPSLCNAPHWGRTWEGFWFKRLSTTPVREKMRDEHAGYTACLMAAGSEEPFLESYVLRKMTVPSITRGFVHHWTDLGAWE